MSKDTAAFVLASIAVISSLFLNAPEAGLFFAFASLLVILDGPRRIR